MEINKLNAISPVDGRYWKTASPFADYFSEYALIRYRVYVEVEYFIALCNIPLPNLSEFDKDKFDDLRLCYREFTLEDAVEIKEIEKETNHDVKAVEYFLKRKFSELGIDEFGEFLHFALTSQDINNTAMPKAMKKAWKEVLEPAISDLVADLSEKAKSWETIPMLARTHGQPASPTRVGKEFRVFVERLERQLDLVRTIPFSAKFGGASGNFNAHHAAYPEIDWPAFGNHFVNDILGLNRSRVTTQIEHYDNMAAFFDNLKRINTILIDLNRDIWTYISMDYFKQKIKAGEIGSSTMPHKVNPIDFENSEGNLGIANALLEHLSAKLPISRLQRDLTDSTVSRNIGVPFAHTLVAVKSLMRGLSKLILNEEKIRKDLNDNLVVVAEGIQTILRREGVKDAYEVLRDLTRKNIRIGREDLKTFIQTLPVSESVKKELLRLSPETYTGILE